MEMMTNNNGNKDKQKEKAVVKLWWCSNENGQFPLWLLKLAVEMHTIQQQIFSSMKAAVKVVPFW